MNGFFIAIMLPRYIRTAGMDKFKALQFPKQNIPLSLRR